MELVKLLLYIVEFHKHNKHNVEQRKPNIIAYKYVYIYYPIGVNIKGKINLQH